mmetsp:Transcript_7984/g.32415  ORF Transcript_7984/g.32415 Transcript_7984/m.32415 type:complete len:527 (-) Transcript_7984:628-2208(-)
MSPLRARDIVPCRRLTHRAVAESAQRRALAPQGTEARACAFVALRRADIDDSLAQLFVEHDANRRASGRHQRWRTPGERAARRAPAPFGLLRLLGFAGGSRRCEVRAWHVGTEQTDPARARAERCHERVRRALLSRALRARLQRRQRARRRARSRRSRVEAQHRIETLARARGRTREECTQCLGCPRSERAHRARCLALELTQSVGAHAREQVHAHARGSVLHQAWALAQWYRRRATGESARRAQRAARSHRSQHLLCGGARPRGSSAQLSAAPQGSNERSKLPAAQRVRTPKHAPPPHPQLERARREPQSCVRGKGLAQLRPAARRVHVLGDGMVVLGRGSAALAGPGVVQPGLARHSVPGSDPGGHASILSSAARAQVAARRRQLGGRKRALSQRGNEAHLELGVRQSERGAATAGDRREHECRLVHITGERLQVGAGDALGEDPRGRERVGHVLQVERTLRVVAVVQVVLLQHAARGDDYRQVCARALARRGRRHARAQQHRPDQRDGLGRLALAHRVSGVAR